MNNKMLCVYTVVCGNYDKVKPITERREDVDYLCFTNYEYQHEVPDSWIHIRLEQSILNLKDLNRINKIKLNEIILDYKFSLYIDGNIELVKLPLLITDLLNSDVDIALYKHYMRSNIYEEARFCLSRGLDYYWNFKKQLNKYKSQGYVSTDLYEANIIYRKHSNEMNVALSQWWDEYNNGSKRDQLSLGYSMYICDIYIHDLGLSDVRDAQDYFKIHSHDYPLIYKLRTRMIKVINKIGLVCFGEL